MPQIDKFEQYGDSLISPGNRSIPINPGVDEAFAELPRFIEVLTPGTLVLECEAGNITTRDAQAGAFLPLRPVKVKNTSTATVVGWV